jgi:hypothetical protein
MCIVICSISLQNSVLNPNLSKLFVDVEGTLTRKMWVQLKQFEHQLDLNYVLETCSDCPFKSCGASTLRFLEVK